MKKMLILVLALVFTTVACGCSNTNLTFDIGEAEGLRIVSRLTGDDVTVTDRALIGSVTENINSLRFEKTSAATDDADYVYQLTWLDENGEAIAEITITEENGHQIRHGGYYYKVGADLCIDTDLIEELRRSTYPPPID